MQNTLIRFSIFLFLATFAFSCADPCQDKICPSNSTCSDGDCVCGSGFEMNLAGECACIAGTVLDPATNTCVEPCTLIDCGENSTCNDGVCACLPGYVMNDLNVCVSVPTVLNYYGNYTTSEDCSMSTSVVYTLSIVEDPSSANQIQILNFWENFTVYAVVSGASFTIPSQSPDGVYTISGSGTLDLVTGDLTLSYSVTDGTNTDVCTNTLYEKA